MITKSCIYKFHLSGVCKFTLHLVIYLRLVGNFHHNSHISIINIRVWKINFLKYLIFSLLNYPIKNYTFDLLPGNLFTRLSVFSHFLIGKKRMYSNTFVLFWLINFSIEVHGWIHSLYRVTFKEYCPINY